MDGFGPGLCLDFNKQTEQGIPGESKDRLT